MTHIRKLSLTEPTEAHTTNNKRRFSFTFRLREIINTLHISIKTLKKTIKKECISLVSTKKSK